jgi:hypothetical protein
MIFLAADNEPTMFLLLTEADCNDMRGGRTKFVDPSATKGRVFNKVVISLHKNQGEVEEMLRKAGHGALLRGMPSPIPQTQEAKCAGCEAIMAEAMLLEGRCIACWREVARAGRNREGLEVVP